MASLSEETPDEPFGADKIVGLENGAAAELHLPSGDRFEVTVRWLGDNEGEPPKRTEIRLLGVHDGDVVRDRTTGEAYRLSRIGT